MGFNDKPGESDKTRNRDKARNSDSAADRAAGDKTKNSGKKTGGNNKNERE